MSQVLAGPLFDYAASCADRSVARYPNAPETSRLAAIHARPTARSLRDAVLARLRKDGALSADECAERMGACVLAIRPRFSELLHMGLIRDSGGRRRNSSGRLAAVWEIQP